MENATDRSFFYIGLFLAVLSTLFIGSSFVFKKKALVRIQVKGRLRAGSGGYSYLKEWLWWAGFLTMGLGEIANFAAYMFAPATLVTPLGALSILVSTVTASKFLNEKITIIGQIGCLLCMTGMIIIVCHSPNEEEIETLDMLMDYIKNPLFIFYIVNILIICFALIFFIAPKFGQRNIFVYITICSAIGSLTVPCCKGLGIAVKQTLTDSEQITNPLTWFLFVLLISCIIVQVNYLNKALDLYDAAIIGPIYYVMFTTFVILVSVILLKEFANLETHEIVSGLCGFVTVVVAVFLLSGFKNVDAGLKDFKRKSKLKIEDEIVDV